MSGACDDHEGGDLRRLGGEAGGGEAERRSVESPGERLWTGGRADHRVTMEADLAWDSLHWVPDLH